MLLLVAGNITTTNLLGNALRCLTAHPEAMERLEVADTPTTSAIEEVLRYRSPVQALARIVTEPVELGDHEIAAGDAVVMWLGSANRDTRVFDHPDTFDIERAPNPHFGFGRGTHYCLGAPLARMEARIGLRALFDRVTDVQRARHSIPSGARSSTASSLSPSSSARVPTARSTERNTAARTEPTSLSTDG